MLLSYLLTILSQKTKTNKLFSVDTRAWGSLVNLPFWLSYVALNVLRQAEWVEETRTKDQHHIGCNFLFVLQWLRISISSNHSTLLTQHLVTRSLDLTLNPPFSHSTPLSPHLHLLHSPLPRPACQQGSVSRVWARHSGGVSCWLPADMRISAPFLPREFLVSLIRQRTWGAYQGSQQGFRVAVPQFYFGGSYSIRQFV